MRILHVDHSPVLGGAERSVLELARAQQARGHHVRVAVGRSGPFTAALEAAGVAWTDLRWPPEYVFAPNASPVWRMARGAGAAVQAAWLLRRLICRWRPDVVQAHTRKSQLVMF